MHDTVANEDATGVEAFIRRHSRRADVRISLTPAKHVRIDFGWRRRYYTATAAAVAGHVSLGAIGAQRVPVFQDLSVQAGQRWGTVRAPLTSTPVVVELTIPTIPLLSYQCPLQETCATASGCDCYSSHPGPLPYTQFGYSLGIKLEIFILILVSAHCRTRAAPHIHSEALLSL